MAKRYPPTRVCWSVAGSVSEGIDKDQDAPRAIQECARDVFPTWGEIQIRYHHANGGWALEASPTEPVRARDMVRLEDALEGHETEVRLPQGRPSLLYGPRQRVYVTRHTRLFKARPVVGVPDWRWKS